MNDRIGWLVAVVVAGTAILVGGGAMLWTQAEDHSVPVGLVVTMAFAALGAYGLAQIGSRRAGFPRTPLGDLAARVDAIGLGAAPGRLSEGTDPDVAELIRAINRLADRAREDVDRAHRDASVGNSAVDSSPIGVLVVGTDGLVRKMNAAFRAMADVRGDPEGRPAIEVVPLAEVHRAVEACLTGAPIEDIQCRSGRADLQIRPVRTQDGGALVVVQDVTPFRQAERARTEFVANVSHELRTPIATIMGYAETLFADAAKLDADGAMMADAILRNTRRLRDLFEDLLELSRIEARREELPVQKQPIKAILDHAVGPAMDVAHKRGQELKVHCADDVVARVNAEALGTIVRNLAHNATNYTPEGGHVRVVARLHESEVLVEVIDDGIGIDRAHHERIFERFYRVDEGRSRRVGGTGLGLAIVKHLALASGCRITMHSEPGKGSTFAVHLAR